MNARQMLPRLLKAVPAAVLLALAGGGLWTAAVRGQAGFDPEKWTPQALRAHADRQALSDQLTATPLADGAARLGREAGWLLMRDTGPQVRSGCPGWLFLAEELRVSAHAERDAAAHMRAVVAVDRALSRRGIALLVAVVPDKSRVEQAQLCGIRRPVSLQGRVYTFVSQLRDAGVEALDLSSTLQGSPTPTFLRTDTHWNETGARLAAAAIGQASRNAGLALAPMAVAQAQALTSRPLQRTGDLVRLAGLDRLPAGLQPPGEVVASSSWAAPVAALMAAPVSGDPDLFADQALPGVALVGTSFSRNSHFMQYLAAALGTQVASFARDGAGFAGSARPYLASAAFRQTPPKLVIWEMPERVLQAAPDAAEAAWEPAEVTPPRPALISSSKTQGLP